jgi:hypothetical protein
MKQEIYADPWAPGDWDTSAPARVWVHLCDAVNWFRITGELPPQEPVTAKEYAEFGLPWFDYYREDMDVLQGSPEFAKVQSVFSLAQQKGDSTVPQEAPLPALPVVAIGPHAPEHTVTEWDGK